MRLTNHRLAISYFGFTYRFFFREERTGEAVVHEMKS